MKKCNCGSCHSGTAVLEHDHIEGNQACGCGHDHDGQRDHDPDDSHPHGQNQEHANSHDDGCGCSHSHGSENLTTVKQDIAAILLTIALTAGALVFTAGVVQSALLVGAILLVGWPILKEGVKGVLRLDLEEMALMTIAVVAAAILGEYVEALMVTLLFRIGQLLEDFAVARAGREVEAVTKIIPENANLLDGDGLSTAVPAKELALGSRILVKSGERFPVDGVVLTGESSVDSSSLTGESVAREVYPGDTVLSGMINLGGVLTCETTSTFEDSTASKIIRMVQDSAAKKGNTERLISRFARIYTPIVIVLAVLVAALPPLLGFGSFSMWISRSLVFLVASCPCALVISVPLSYFAGIGGASKQGILIKGSKYMETLSAAKTVVFDKTGTLTTGRLQVSGVTAAGGYTEDQVLSLAGAMERYSNHPIAKAVTAAAGDTASTAIAGCEEITSYGMRATQDGETLLCGSKRLMEREGVDVSALPADANVYLAKSGKAMGAVQVFDNPRPEAAQAVRQLKEMGVTHTAMLTGDGEGPARQVREMTGLDDAKSGLLPGDKVDAFAAIKAKTTGATLFVGDGINDSPVLAGADAGVAIGLAADAAIEAADVVLLSDKLTSLPQAIRISRRTGRLARANITFALLVKLLVFGLAISGFASMWMAVFADVGVTILSVLNATRALRFH